MTDRERKSSWLLAAELVKQGLGCRQIAGEMGKPPAQIAQLLIRAVGEGQLRLSDIFFTIPQDTQRKCEKVNDAMRGRDVESIRQSCRSRGMSPAEFKLFNLARDARDGDMYRYLRELEVSLHALVRKALEATYRAPDDAWWRQGVPLRIRKHCAETREEEEGPEGSLEPYAFTNFIALKEIIEAKWKPFMNHVPVVFVNDKNKLLQRFDRLNKIRNRVMHPVKLMPVIQDDFEFVRDCRETLDESQWRFGEKVD